MSEAVDGGKKEGSATTSSVVAGAAEEESVVTKTGVVVHYPSYDRTKLVPSIVHFGMGGFHRSHMALYLDELLEKGLCDWSIVGVGVKAPYDRVMHEALMEHGGLYTLVERDDSGYQMRVIGSITNHIYAPESPEAVFTQLTDPRIRIVSLTVTEGGYFTSPSGEFASTHPEILHDLEHPEAPVTVFGYIVEALRRRLRLGLPPFTVLSCDNLQSNGDVARFAVLSFARLTSSKSNDADGLVKWIEEHGRFPNTMVDRITPQTKDADKQFVRDHPGSLKDAWPVVAEPFRQWIIEDNFCSPGGRPPFELVGAQFTEDILPYELMKLRLLNASHSCMCYLGHLCGFSLVHDVMRDPAFERLLKQLMANEVEPLLPVPHGVDLKAYQKSLVHRFSNSTLQDQVSRLCLDGSAKMPKFIAPSILEYYKRRAATTTTETTEEEKVTTNSSRLPMALTLGVAGWIRYLDRVDEQGKEIRVVDPMSEELKTMSSREVLKHKAIFGELAEVEEFVETVLQLVERLRSRGARSVLEETVNRFPSSSS